MNRKIVSSPGASAPAEDYDRGEMIALLAAAADVDGSRTMAAAMHLLSGTQLPGQLGFARHVDIEDGILADPDLTQVPCAWVRDWNALLADRDAIATEQQLTLVTLAASYAEQGRPVSLHDTIRYSATRFGPETAQRIIEATAIAAGVGLATIEFEAGAGEAADARLSREP